MNTVVILCVCLFTFLLGYWLGKLDSVGKMARQNCLPTHLTFKVVYSDKTRTVLESIEVVPRTYTIATSNLHEKIRPGDMVRSLRFNEKCYENNRVVRRNKFLAIEPSIVKVTVEA